MSNAVAKALAISAVLFASACTAGTDAPTAPLTDGRPGASLDRIGGLPFTGACATTYELTDLVLVDDKDLVSANYADGGRCRLSHLGAGSATNQGHIDFSTIPARGNGTFVLIAANGDRLEGTERLNYDVPDDNGLFSFSGSRTVTGGTGRFAGAHGVLSVSGTGSTVALTTVQNMSGHIAY
jgi:hypothetical protein